MTTKQLLTLNLIVVALAACGGENGKTSLLTLVDEPAGANCPQGGKRVDVGVDANANGGLDASEVTRTSYVCDGASGSAGPAGQDAAACSIADNPDGGKTIRCGAGDTITLSAAAQVGDTCSVVDNHDNTVTIHCGTTEVTVALQPGAEGHVSLVDITPEPEGAHCGAGGQKVEAGVDQDDDGQLAADEVTSTQYVCDGAVTSSIYGDGSDGAGNFSGVVDWVTSPPSGTLQFTDLSISGTLTVPSGLIVRATGTVTVSGSIIVARNSDSSQGVAQTAAAVGDMAQGGDGLNTALAHTLVNPGRHGGSVGGTQDGLPGNGGGTLVMLAGGALSISSSGSIVANGGDGTTDEFMTGAGGGGGGIIVLAAKTAISNEGTLSAKGGDGGAAAAGTSPSGGGGGGIVNLFAPVITSGTIDVAGGAAGSGLNTAGFGGGGGGSGGAGGRAGGSSAGTAMPGSPGLSFENLVADPTALFVLPAHL